jgi:ABC-type Fe3+ transport system permease subunit
LLLIGLANLGVFVNWLETLGVLAWAQPVCDHYVTETAITVIVVLLVLLPSGTVIAICVQRCRVCDALLFRRGKYCSECGSRV